MKKLVKIYRNKAVFLENGNYITVETIPPESAEILDFYNNKIFLYKTLDK